MDRHPYPILEVDASRSEDRLRPEMEVDATNLASAEPGGISLLPRGFPEAKLWEKLGGSLYSGPE
jgi:hypothetical protein